MNTHLFRLFLKDLKIQNLTLLLSWKLFLESNVKIDLWSYHQNIYGEVQNNYTKKLIENLDNSLEGVLLTNTSNFILLYIDYNLFNYHRCHLNQNHPILYNDHTFVISNLGTSVCNNFLSSFEFLFCFFYLRHITITNQK